MASSTPQYHYLDPRWSRVEEPLDVDAQGFATAERRRRGAAILLGGVACLALGLSVVSAQADRADFVLPDAARQIVPDTFENMLDLGPNQAAD